MRQPLASVAAIAGLALLPALSLSLQDPAPAQLDLAGLKSLLTNMGHELKDLSETKFETTIAEDGFDVPLAFEVSPSGRYVWVTAFPGKVPEAGLPAEQANALLRQNHSIQPAHFYITSNGSLMVAMAVENRALDAVIMRRVITKLAADVATTADAWSLPEDELEIDEEDY